MKKIKMRLLLAWWKIKSVLNLIVQIISLNCGLLMKVHVQVYQEEKIKGIKRRDFRLNFLIFRLNLQPANLFSLTTSRI